MIKQQPFHKILPVLGIVIVFGACSGDSSTKPTNVDPNKDDVNYASIVQSVSLERYTVNLRDKLNAHAGDNRGNIFDSSTGNYEASEQLKEVRAMLYSHFLALGLSTAYDHYRPTVPDFGINVVAELTGITKPEQIIIIGAHYDSVGNPGACDNASGTAALMELATVLSEFRFEKTIRFIAWDEEETGHIGSSTYAENHKNEDILIYFNIDSIGRDGGTHRVRVGSQSEANRPFMNTFVSFLTEYSPEVTALLATENDNSDHNEFESRGIRNFEIYTYDYIDPGYGYYHMPEDNVDTPGQINYQFGYWMIRAGAAFVADQAVYVTESI